MKGWLQSVAQLKDQMTHLTWVYNSWRLDCVYNNLQTCSYLMRGAVTLVKWQPRCLARSNHPRHLIYMLCMATRLELYAPRSRSFIYSDLKTHSCNERTPYKPDPVTPSPKTWISGHFRAFETICAKTQLMSLCTLCQVILLDIPLDE